MDLTLAFLDHRAQNGTPVAAALNTFPYKCNVWVGMCATWSPRLACSTVLESESSGINLTGWNPGPMVSYPLKLAEIT